jgi:hypothetical protein
MTSAFPLYDYFIAVSVPLGCCPVNARPGALPGALLGLMWV